MGGVEGAAACALADGDGLHGTVTPVHGRGVGVGGARVSEGRGAEGDIGSDIASQRIAGIDSRRHVGDADRQLGAANPSVVVGEANLASEK